MVGTMVEWDRYLRWNRAVSDVVYATSNAGQPVYLDLESDVLDAIRDKAQPEEASPTLGLVRAVRGVLRLNDGPAVILRAILQRLGRWEDGDLEDAPPTLALLAVMSLAAENMREADGKAANNFYGRLAELLSLDEKQCEDFIAAYRRVHYGRATSAILWGSLSSWLEALEGNRGLATVFAERNVHVSLPMSQALVRQVDRDKFRTMFALYGLAPRSTLPVAELADVIDDWMSHEPCPASNQLVRLWRRDADARERISDVARLTLESWDGSGVREAHGGRAPGLHLDHIRVRARMRSFPRKGIELSLLLPAVDAACPETATVVGLDGEDLGQIDLVPAASGWLVLADADEIDAASFLAGEMNLRRPGTGPMIRRRPRRVVPLRFDDLLQGYLECERVNLGDDFLLVVHQDVAASVDLVLDATARPGHERHDNLDGLPPGWVLYDRVQILSSVPPALVQRLDLNSLQPIASSHAALQGGLVLPGNIKKWSSFRPPELRVSVDEATSVSATVTSIRALTSPAPEPVTEKTDEPVLIWDLTGQYLTDGDYEIAILVDDEPMGRAIRMRLRSADHPALVVEDGAKPIGHDPDNQGFGLLASVACSARFIQVAPTHGGELSANESTTSMPPWVEARQQSGASRQGRPETSVIHIPSPQSGSCMLTGAHVMVIDTVYPGQPKKKLIDGVCKHCGITKRYPTWGRMKRVKNAQRPTGPVFDPSSLDPIHPRTRVDWSLGLDALSHLRAGPISSLERVAAQIDPTGLFADTFARRLEVLGHIEIQRSPTSLQPLSWATNPPSLVGLSDGRFVLVGFRSESMVAAVEDAAHRHGLTLEEERIEGPPVLGITTSDPDVLEEVVYELGATTGLEPQLLPEAARALAAWLQPFSKALLALPTTGATSARSIDRWDPVTARFSATTSSHAPGAYRLRNFGNVYIYRRPEDISEMTAILGDARIVKYAAALDTGQPLVGYDEASRVLYVPLGADLPGLYGRAAVLASGRPPAEDTKQRMLRYSGVCPPLAARIQSSLMS